MKRQLTEEVLEQRRKISRFDEEIRKNEDSLTSGMVAFWLYVVLEMIFFLIPIGGEEDGVETIYFLGIIYSVGSTMFYIRRYLYVVEDRKNIPIWKKCRYFPLSKKEFLKSRFQYLSRLLWKCAVAAVITQCAITLLAYGKITVWNLLYPIIFAGILPFLFASFSIVTACRDVAGKGRRKVS